MRRVKSKHALIALGNMVHMPLVQQEWAKVDAYNLTAIVININNHFGVCQLAVKNGIIHPLYMFHKICHLPNLGNNRYLNYLEDAYKNWKKMNFIAPRMASLCESFVGGQGIFQCKCNGKCRTTQCNCLKNSIICTSVVTATVTAVRTMIMSWHWGSGRWKVSGQQQQSLISKQTILFLETISHEYANDVC